MERVIHLLLSLTVSERYQELQKFCLRVKNSEVLQILVFSTASPAAEGITTPSGTKIVTAREESVDTDTRFSSASDVIFVCRLGIKKVSRPVHVLQGHVLQC